mmetsp:Transcript_46439/g.86809  ORF Transcript_46439/g.86809 Transcript_46439/m.86809 type:complete len:82 (-) Transcript_46439:742-987(-)
MAFVAVGPVETVYIRATQLKWNGICRIIGTFVVNSRNAKASVAIIARRPFLSSASAVQRRPLGSQPTMGNSKSFSSSGSKL